MVFVLLTWLCVFSDLRHPDGDRHPAQRRHAAAPQSSSLLRGHHRVLLSPGPQAQEDLSRLRRFREGCFSTNHSWGSGGLIAL